MQSCRDGSGCGCRCVRERVSGYCAYVRRKREGRGGKRMRARGPPGREQSTSQCPPLNEGARIGWLRVPWCASGDEGSLAAWGTVVVSFHSLKAPLFWTRCRDSRSTSWVSSSCRTAESTNRRIGFRISSIQ